MTMMNSHRANFSKRTSRMPVVAGVAFFSVIAIVIVPIFSRAYISAAVQTGRAANIVRSLLAAHTTSRTELVQENDRLRGIVAALSQNPSLDTNVHTIAHIDTTFGYDTERGLPIDIASVSEIAIGNSVTSVEGYLVGRIVSLDARFAYIRMLSEEEKIIVVVGESNEVIELSGRGGVTLFGTVPRQSAITEGMEVYSHDTARSKIGVVEKVIFDERDPQKKIFVRMYVNPSQLSDVIISQK